MAVKYTVPAFSLLETVVALAIMIAVTSASVVLLVRNSVPRSLEVTTIKEEDRIEKGVHLKYRRYVDIFGKVKEEVEIHD